MRRNIFYAFFLFCVVLVMSCAPALHYAVEDNDLARVRDLLKKGADINERDFGGGRQWQWTPLMVASYEGNLVIAEYLIIKGASVDLQINRKTQHAKFNGFTALHFAAFYGHTEIAKALIDSGADFTIQDKKGFTAYDYARQYNFNEIVTYIDTVKKQKEGIKNKRGKD